MVFVVHVTYFTTYIEWELKLNQTISYMKSSDLLGLLYYHCSDL
jgi:hypothetical protein